MTRLSTAPRAICLQSCFGTWKQADQTCAGVHVRFTEGSLRLRWLTARLPVSRENARDFCGWKRNLGLHQLSKQAEVWKVRAHSEIFLTNTHRKETPELSHQGPPFKSSPDLCPIPTHSCFLQSRLFVSQIPWLLPEDIAPPTTLSRAWLFFLTSNDFFIVCHSLLIFTFPITKITLPCIL